MTLQEKILYHQAHPFKLATDGLAGLVALILFWLKMPLAGLLVALVPSLLVSLVLIIFTNLEKIKQSRLGGYLQTYMTPPLDLIRLLGYLLAALGAWYRVIWPISAGLLVILLAWLRGVLSPVKK